MGHKRGRARVRGRGGVDEDAHKDLHIEWRGYALTPRMWDELLIGVRRASKERIEGGEEGRQERRPGKESSSVRNHREEDGELIM